MSFSDHIQADKNFLKCGEQEIQQQCQEITSNNEQDAKVTDNNEEDAEAIFKPMPVFAKV